MRPRKLDRITISPAIMNGQPCIPGMRVTVRRVSEAVALYSERAGVKQAGSARADDRNLGAHGIYAVTTASPTSLQLIFQKSDPYTHEESPWKRLVKTSAR